MQHIPLLYRFDRHYIRMGVTFSLVLVDGKVIGDPLQTAALGARIK
jgi:hypothetical protein